MANNLGGVLNKGGNSLSGGQKFNQTQQPTTTSNASTFSSNQQSTQLPSLREAYVTIINKMQSDPNNRAMYETALSSITTDPTSPYYNPYSQANSNNWNKDNQKRTNSALSELNDIRNRVNYWVNRTDRNYSDDEIVSMINIGDYSTLSSLEKNRQQGFPLEVLAPVDYSEDAIRGMIWSARNGGQTSGNYAVDAAMGLMGRGNQSPANSRAEMLDATNEMYAPYKAGKSVSTDNYAYQFGLTGDFDQNWLNQNTWMLNNPDLQPTYTKIFKAEQNTLELEAIVDEWNDYVEGQIDKGVEPEMIFGDSVFESHKDFAPIKKLIDSYASGDLVETTRAINFDYNDQRRRAQAAYERKMGSTTPEQLEEEVAATLKADTHVEKPEGFIKRTWGKTTDWVRSVFDGEETPEEATVLKVDDGSFEDVKTEVGHAIETGAATTEEMHDVAVSDADSYAYKNLLPANRRIKELEAAKTAFAAVEAFETKWNAEIESGNIHIYENPEYQADLVDVEAAYALYDEFGGNLAAVEEELAEQMAIRAEVMNRYGYAASYSDYASSDEAALQTLGFIEYYSGFNDETFDVPSYDWQDALVSGEKTWEQTNEEITAIYSRYGGLIENINTAIEVASANGLDESYLEGLRATKRAVLKEREAIRTAQLRDNPDFEEKVRAFDASYKPYKAPFINIKGVTDPSREEAITAIVHDPSAALTELGGYVPDVNVGQMAEDERNIYKYIYMTEGVEAAIQYAETLKDALGWRFRDSMMEEAEVTSFGNAVGKNITSVMLNTASFMGLFDNALKKAKGEEVDVNSPLNVLTSYSGGIRQSTKEKIEGNEWLQEHPLMKNLASLGYDATMTSADSAARSMVGGKAFAEALGSLNAAQTTLVDAKLRNASDFQAFILAGISAAGESATEHLPIGNLFETFENAGVLGVKDLAAQVFKGVVTDAPGEMLSELIGGVSDELVMKEMSAAELRIAQLMEENGMRRYEAEKQVQRETLSDIAYAGLLSVFSTTSSEMLAYGTGKVLNVGNYARGNPDAENVLAESPTMQESTETAETPAPAPSQSESNNTPAEAEPSASNPYSAPKNLSNAPRTAAPAAPKPQITTTARTATTPQEKAAIVIRDNKLLSGGYTVDMNGNVVPKTAKRKLTNNEKAAIALGEAAKSSYSASAATVSSTLQILGGVDSVTADAVAKGIVAEFGQDALTSARNIFGYNLENASGSDFVALAVAALTDKNSEAAELFRSKTRNYGSEQRIIAEAAATVTKEQVAAYVGKNAVASATVDILKNIDNSRYDAIRKEIKTAEAAYNAAEAERQKLNYEVDGLRQKISSYRATLKHHPEDVQVKNAFVEANKKVEELTPKLEAAKKKAGEERKAYMDTSERLVAERQQLVVQARSEAQTLVNNYLEEQAKSEEAAKLQAEAEAEEAAARAVAQQEFDNLSEMEFQNYVEEVAPEATPEQVEELRQEFAEQQQMEEQAAVEQTAKDEAKGIVQTPEQKAESKALRNAEALGKRFKTNVKAIALPSYINGWYDGDKNELVINSNLTQEEMLEQTVIHEFSHKAERGGKAYASFSQALLDLEFDGDRKAIAAAIERTKREENRKRARMSQTGGQETYGKDLRSLDDGDARKELVAQTTKRLLDGDPDLIERFANTDIDSAYSFFDRLKFVLKRMVGIKGTYAERLKHTTYLFQKALAKAAENGVKTTKQRVDESKHPASVQFSIDQWARATGFGFERSADNKGGYIIVDKDGNKVDKVTADMMVDTPAGKLVSTAVAKGTMSTEEANGANQFLADVMNMVVEFEDQETVWELVGSALFSSVKNNSDKQYGRTVDYGTICSKTRDIVNVMSETMLEKGRGLTREEVIMAYNKTFGEGMSVPCPPCYVFSRWMGVPSLLETMRKGQERFANATDADVNDYVNGVKERYAGELAKTKKNGEKKTLAEVMGTRKTNILNKLEDIRKQVASERFSESSLAEIRDQQQALEAELEDIELYNWVTQVLCETDKKGKPIETNGKLSIDKKYKAVPNEVLLDMRKTGDFASQYAKAWKFRTTRGAGMGKAQLPYAGAEVGDVLTGANRWKANENPLYNGDDAKAKRALANAAKRTLAQNLIGGNRFQSTSDFRPEWGLDYLMTFFEMQAIGAKGQLYTKVIEAVDLFASAGIEVNLSVMAKGDGWHLDENGNPVITLEDFSPVTGIDAGQAMQKSQEYDNVQLILVGMNDTHIELALADDRISFVIPWHSSGNSKETLGQMMEAVGEKRGKAQDYSESQTDKIGEQTPEQKAAWDMRKKILTGGFFVKGKDVQPTDAEMATIAGNSYLLDLYNKMYVDKTSDAYHVKLSAAQASQIFPHEYWDTNSTYDTADVNGKRFVEYCESMGIQPRFAQFADKKGYWKLLIDRRMYGRDGSYRPAGYINASNVKVNALPQSVSQAKPGTNEQIQNAKQKLIDEIDARTAELHKYDMEAEHAAPSPAIPANVQFSLADDSDVLPWDDTLSMKANIENLASTKALDARIETMRNRTAEINKELNKRFGRDVKAKHEFTKSNDPLAVELRETDVELSRAVADRIGLERKLFSKEASLAFDRYRKLKQEYDEKKAAHNRYRSAEPFYNYQPKLVEDYEAAKKEYEKKFLPELEKRRAQEVKHREWLAKREAEKKAAEEKARAEEEAAKAAEMAVAETEAVEEEVSYEEQLADAGEKYTRGEISADEYAEVASEVVEEPDAVEETTEEIVAEEAEPSATPEVVEAPAEEKKPVDKKENAPKPKKKAEKPSNEQKAESSATSKKVASAFAWKKHTDPARVLAALPEFESFGEMSERIKAARKSVPPELYKAYVDAKWVTKQARQNGMAYHEDPKERVAWAKYEALVDKYNAKLADGEQLSIKEGKKFSVLGFLDKNKNDDALAAFNNSMQELRRGYDAEPSGIYENPSEGTDNDYGGEEAQPEPTNEFTYGTLDPAFSIPKPPAGQRVHETSKKFVADESLPDAVRMEHAKPEEAYYDHDSNEAQNARAAQKIRERGIDAEYERLMKSTTSADNIAGLQILREIYNREGTRNMGKLMDVTRKEKQLRSDAGTALQASKSEIAKMMPSEIIARFVGEGEDNLEKHIKDYPKAAEKLKQKAAEKTEVVKSVVGDVDLDEVSDDNKWLEPLNKAQLEAIKMYGLEKVERAGIFYNRATIEQRMLEAIIQTKDPFADTGMGMNLFERLEYIRSGVQCLTIADLNYIQRNLGEFTHFGGMLGGRTADIAINRAIEAYGNTNVASGFEKFRSFRYVNMLTSLASAIKNLGSNAIQILGAVNVSHELEVGIDALIGISTGKRTKATLNVQERIDGWNAFKNESVNTFRDYFVYKVDTNPKNDPFNTHRKGRVYQGKVFEGARNLQSFLMSFGDRNFWKRAYINSLAEQQKLLDAGKLFNEDGSVPTEEQIIERARYEADYATLSEDNFVSRQFKRLAIEHPVAADVISFYMPFTGIPTNVIKRGFEYSPINAVVTVGRALIDKKQGKNFDQKRFVEGVCRPLTAVGVYVLGSMLYNAGKIKMGTGDDEDEGTKYYDARTALGDQYSAYFVGDETNASLSALGPYGTMLLFGAAVSSELEKQGEDGKRWLVAMYNAMNHNFDSIIDASYLSGITDFFNPNTDESIGETALRLFIENASGQMIPAPIAQLAEYLDPYVRETKDKDKIIEICKNVANRIPYLREMLPKKVYVTGTAAKTREPAVTKFFDPFTRSHQYEEPELEEAMRLYQYAKAKEYENAAKLLPEDILRGTKSSFKYEKHEYELTDAQKEAFKIKYGETWKARVAKQINSSGWEALSEDMKMDRIKTIMTQSKNDTMEWAVETWFD